MTFTDDLTTNTGKVRWHIGDNDAAAPMFTDEQITAALALYGSVEAAVVGCLRNLLAKMAKPNFEADWLKVDLASGRAGIKMLLSEKQQEFGLSGITAKIVRTFRGDTDEADV